MTINSEPKRWSMLSMASPRAARPFVFNPDTSGLVSIEKITVLQYYGGNAWATPGGGGGVAIEVIGHYYRTLLAGGRTGAY